MTERKYTISELKYPIAIHITSKEQHDKLKEEKIAFLEEELQALSAEVEA